MDWDWGSDSGLDLGSETVNGMASGSDAEDGAA